MLEGEPKVPRRQDRNTTSVVRRHTDQRAALVRNDAVRVYIPIAEDKGQHPAMLGPEHSTGRGGTVGTKRTLGNVEGPVPPESRIHSLSLSRVAKQTHCGDQEKSPKVAHIGQGNRVVCSGARPEPGTGRPVGCMRGLRPQPDSEPGYPSRCIVFGEKAGKHTASYSAEPSNCGAKRTVKGRLRGYLQASVSARVIIDASTRSTKVASA